VARQRYSTINAVRDSKQDPHSWSTPTGAVFT